MMTTNANREPRPARRIRRRVTGGALVIAAFCTLIAAQSAHAEAERAERNGYPMLKFKIAGRPALLVGPERPASGKPWIWRTEFFGIDPQADTGSCFAFSDVSKLRR